MKKVLRVLASLVCAVMVMALLPFNAFAVEVNVEQLSISVQPKLVYAAGEALDLSELELYVVGLLSGGEGKYKEFVGYSEFDGNYSVDIENGTILDESFNGRQINITAYGVSVKTDPIRIANFYELTVEKGSGSGTYAEGSTVKISANAPAQGLEFSQWTTEDGGEFKDPYSSETYYTMPSSDAVVTPVYTEEGEGIVYTANLSYGGVTVTDGSGERKVNVSFYDANGAAQNVSDFRTNKDTLVVTQNSTGVAVSNPIVFDILDQNCTPATAPFMLVLNGINIEIEEGGCIVLSSYASVKLIVAANIKMPNTLTGGIRKIGRNGTLTIACEKEGTGIPGYPHSCSKRCGKLTVTGELYSAAIGGGPSGASGNIHITGAVVTANGGVGTESNNYGDIGAGIGGGYYGSGKNISISGGIVTANCASANRMAAGVGGGRYSAGNLISISGGTLVANGYFGVGSGEGGRAATELIVTGGSINATFSTPPVDGDGNPVYALTVPISAEEGQSVVTNRLSNGMRVAPSYGTNSLITDEDGNITFWLPKGEYDGFFVVDNVGYSVNASVQGEGEAAVQNVVTYLLGDLTMDGGINVADVSTMLLSVVNGGTFNEAFLFQGDLNGDGIVNIIDASIMLRYAAGLIDRFPVEESEG